MSDKIMDNGGSQLTQRQAVPTPTCMTFLDKITELADARGWDQQTLEKQAGLPKGRISKWRGSKRNQVQISHALAVARALGVSLDSLADPVAPWPPQEFQPLTFDERVILRVAHDIGLDAARKLLTARDTDIALDGKADMPRHDSHRTNARRVKRNVPPRQG